MPVSKPEVRVLGAEHAEQVVDVLCESFVDYPVMRFVIGPEADYERRLQTLITFFVMARVYRNEVLLGVGDFETLQAAAMVSYSGVVGGPPELGALRERTWASLGPDARDRYEAFGTACAAFGIGQPHLHLNMIGVRASQQGLGLGRALMDSVHSLSERDASSAGVSLTTEVEGNVILYKHFGYDLLGTASVASTLTTWAFFRPDRDRGSLTDHPGP